MGLEFGFEAHSTQSAPPHYSFEHGEDAKQDNRGLEDAPASGASRHGRHEHKRAGKK